MGLMSMTTHLYEGYVDQETRQFSDKQIFGTPGKFAVCCMCALILFIYLFCKYRLHCTRGDFKTRLWEDDRLLVDGYRPLRVSRWLRSIFWREC